MKIEVKQSVLKVAFELLKPAILDNSARRILRSISMDVSDNELYMEVFNTEMSTSVKLPVTVNEPGRIIVDNLIIKTISTFQASDIITIEKKGDGVLVKKGRKKHTLACVIGEEFPELPKLKGYKPIEVNKFMLYMDKALCIIGNSPDNEILEGVNIDPVTGKVTSGDKTRVGLLEGLDLEGNPVVPSKSNMLNIVNLIKLTIAESKKKNDFLATFGTKEIQKRIDINMSGFSGTITKGTEEEPVEIEWNSVISSFNDDYPTKGVEFLNKLLDTPAAITCTFELEKIKEIMKTCTMYSQLADKQNRERAVKISPQKNGAVFSMHISNLVDIDEFITCDVEMAETFYILFDPQMLQPILSRQTSENITLNLYGQNSPFIVSGDTDWKYIQHIIIESESEI